jgi:AcrR family transcriptional regulator
MADTHSKKSEVGRPRSGTTLRPDLSPADQILDAAARLFVQRGYTATSTRAIADEVGIRQASLYYHFPSKERLLDVLLLRTVEPSMTMAATLAELDAPAEVRLFALISYDVGQLVRAPHNVGTLYLLPEVRAGGFERFQDERMSLQNVYASLIAQVLTADGPGAPSGTRAHEGKYLTEVVFALVESVIAIRADHPDDEPAVLVEVVASSCLHVLGFDAAAVAAITSAGHAMLDDVA